MNKPPIDTEAAGDWALSVYLQSDCAWCSDGQMSDAQLQEYSIARSILLDGVNQDCVPEIPWWAFWRKEGGAQ